MIENDPRLIEYALDLLDDQTRRVVGRELEASAEMRDELRAIEETLASVPLAEQPLSASEALRSRILGAIQAETRFDGFAERFAQLFDLQPDPARKLLAGIDECLSAPWQSTLIPGVRIHRFAGGPRVAAATCGLVHVRAGQLFPAHRHQADEWILCLQGRAREDSGRMLEAGDLSCFPQGSAHTFRTLRDEPFVFAVLLQKDNKWLIGRSLGDFLRAKISAWRGKRPS